MKRLAMFLMVLAFAVPSMAQAETKIATFSAPYQLGPSGGDNNNRTMIDPATGQITLIRHQVAGISGGLGCGGSGPFAYFKGTLDAEAPVKSVVVNFKDAVVGPYAFVQTAVLQGETFVDSFAKQGPITGAGSVTMTVRNAATGPLEFWFGLQVSSACPNFDFGSITITSVDVFTA